MRAARVTVVVPYVCVSVRSFLSPGSPRASRPQNIGTYVFTATRKNFYNRDFRNKKKLRSEATASLACLRCHQLHLNPKRQIQKETAEGWKAIDSRDYN